MTTMRYRGYALALSDKGWHAEGYRIVIGPYGSIEVLKAELDRRAGFMIDPPPGVTVRHVFGAAGSQTCEEAHYPLRPALWAATGHDLDQWGREHNLVRYPGEPDAAFRGRICKPPLRDHDAVVREGRAYSRVAVLLGPLAWIALIAACMAFKHWVL